MRVALLALAAGLLALRWLPVLPPAWTLVSLVVLGLMLLPFRSYPLALGCFGFVWACTCAQWALDDRLAPALDGRILWLEGTVSGLPEAGQGVTRFELVEARAEGVRLPERMRLSWYGDEKLRAGERWRLLVRLNRPYGLVNPQSFDYEAWLLAKHLGATGSVKQGERSREAGGLAAWRDGLRQRLVSVDAFGRQGGLAALVLGDGSGVSREDWRLLQDTGTVHLMVISGQHISLLAGVLYGLVAWLARRGLWPRCLPWLPCACAVSFLAALVYGLLAGFEVPVQRACVMVAVVLLWRLRYRQLGIVTPLLTALVAVLLGDPLASLQPGFWLSFAAVGILLLVFAGRLGAIGTWRTLLRAQWTMAIGLLPPLLALGLPLSLTSPLANLVAEPWVSLAVVPLALLGTLLLPVPWLGSALLWLAGGALQGLFMVLGAISDWLPAWQPLGLPGWGWCLVASGALLVLLPAGVPVRLLGLPMLVWAFFPSLSRPGMGMAEVWMLDVGQGLAVVVRTQRHALLYDTGPRYGDFDLGERVVVPSLRQLGVRGLDILLISHADSDHSGGALAVRRAFPIGRTLSGEAQALPAELQSVPCVDGERWSWDGVAFETWRWPRAERGNAASCVLRIEANGERLLLTGDIDAVAEHALLAAGRDVRSEWLSAPHHGSRSSSSPAFAAAVGPRFVLVSRGRNNPFGHPHPSVVTRYRSLSAEVLDSVQTGAVEIRLGAFAEPRLWRDQGHFWREK